MKFNEKQKIVLVLLVFLVVIGGLMGLNYLKFRNRSELLAKIDALVAEETKANNKIKRIPELREKRANLANIIDQYAEILPKEEHTQHDAFVEIIDSYRRDTQIVIQRTEYLRPKVEGEEGKKKSKENFIRHRYRFKLVGTVPDFLRFINKIENHTRFLKIDAIAIKPLGAADEMNEFDDKADSEEIAKGRIPFKDIEVTVSTYTYSKGGEGEKK
jgi:Tfp pilus assembly protein PilO